MRISSDALALVTSTLLGRGIDPSQAKETDVRSAASDIGVSARDLVSQVRAFHRARNKDVSQVSTPREPKQVLSRLKELLARDQARLGLIGKECASLQRQLVEALLPDLSTQVLERAIALTGFRALSEGNPVGTYLAARRELQDEMPSVFHPFRRAQQREKLAGLLPAHLNQLREKLASWLERADFSGVGKDAYQREEVLKKQVLRFVGLTHQRNSLQGMVTQTLPELEHALTQAHAKQPQRRSVAKLESRLSTYDSLSRSIYGFNNYNSGSLLNPDVWGPLMASTVATAPGDATASNPFGGGGDFDGGGAGGTWTEGNVAPSASPEAVWGGAQASAAASLEDSAPLEAGIGGSLDALWAGVEGVAGAETASDVEAEQSVAQSPASDSAEVYESSSSSSESYSDSSSSSD